MKTLSIMLLMLMLVSYRQADYSICSAETTMQVKLYGRDFSNESNFNPAFYQQCVTAELSNPSGREAAFSIPAGTFLMPDNGSLQRLMVTRTERITVQPNGRKKVQLYAMCTQASNGAPGPATRFVMAANTNAPLVKLAELIEKNNYQNHAGQGAVWALSDNHSQSGIYDEDTNATYTLRSYIAQTRNEPCLPANAPRTFDGRWFVPVKVVYNFSLHSAHRITMRLYTNDSRVFETIAEDSLTAAGKHYFEKLAIVPQNEQRNRTGLKMLRWIDGTLADIRYFTKADSTVTME